MARTKPLKFKRTVKAPPAEVYRALTSSTALREWFCDAAFAEPRKGGRAYFAWNDGYYAVGQFGKVAPGRKVNYSWQGTGEPEPTMVKISLAEKDGGTAVTVAHEGIGAGKKWGKHAENIARGWETALDNLAVVLETGEDPRFTMRPMLGVTGLEDLTPEMVERLGTPVTEGLRVEGTLAEMGAAQAGLQAGDVLAAIGKSKVGSYSQLASALQPHRAGDTIPVTFYRGSEKHTVDMTLSKRPLPDIPWDPSSLAEAARRVYERSDAGLEQAVKDVTEAEASFRPAPDEWTIKEIIAHLIHSERDWQSYIGELTMGTERWYDSFGGNSHARARATVATYGSLPALIAALRQAEQETVALLATLPPDFVARKASYWRVAYNSLQDIYHAREHFAQIAAALTAARGAPPQPG